MLNHKTLKKLESCMQELQVRIQRPGELQDTDRCGNDMLHKGVFSPQELQRCPQRLVLILETRHKDKRELQLSLVAPWKVLF
jgi:hypothetical protein